MTTHTKFPLGQLHATPGAIEAIEGSGQWIADFVSRHANGDWGDVSDEDRQANEHALLVGSRLLSVYHTSNGVKLWIITEAADDNGDRAATTVLLPEEY